MVLELLALLLIGLAAFSHWRSGIWSAVLTLWAALLAGAVAFGFYIPLSRAVFGGEPTLANMALYWSDGLVLLLLFIVSFGVLRIASEQLLRNSMSFKPLVDGIAGAAIGGLSGYIAAGVLAVFAQMMPLSPTSVLGYQPFDLVSGKRANHMRVKADDVVLGLYNGLMGGSLSGGEGDLASLYAANGRGGEMVRGDQVDDILYYYFRRRVLHAMATSEAMKMFSTNENRGLAVKAGESKTIRPRRDMPGTAISIQGVRMVPYGAWVKGFELAAEEGGSLSLVWPMETGAVAKPGSGDVNVAVLLVDVAFRPGTEDGMSMSLGDWSLVPAFSTGDKKEEPVPLPKLFGAGKSATEGDKTTVTPLAAIPVEGETVVLDAKAVSIEGHRRASGLPGGADVEYVANAAIWNFGPKSGDTRATLAFIVPALSLPGQYGLRCGALAAAASGNSSQASQNKEGLFGKRTGEAAPLKWRIEDVQWKSSLPTVKEPAKGCELVVVRMEWTQKSGKESVLVKAADLLLRNDTLKKEYTARLLEVLETKDGQAVPKRTLRDADIEVRNPKVEKSETLAEQISTDWEIFFTGGGRATVDLVFEAPIGRRSDKFSFAVAEKLSTEAPDWYLLRNVAMISSRTHVVNFEDSAAKASIKLDLGDGRVVDWGAGQSGGQKILVITISIAPSKTDDKKYYEFKVEDADLRSTTGARAEVALFGYRLEDEPSFRRPAVAGKQERRILLKGLKEFEFAYQVPKGLTDLQLMVKGFKGLKLPND